MKKEFSFYTLKRNSTISEPFEASICLYEEETKKDSVKLLLHFDNFEKVLNHICINNEKYDLIMKDKSTELAMIKGCKTIEFSSYLKILVLTFEEFENRDMYKNFYNELKIEIKYQNQIKELL